MDPTYPLEAEEYRAEVRARLRAMLPDGWQGMGSLNHDEAEAFSHMWRRKLYENGLLGVTWPKEYGGGGRSKLDQVVLAEELAHARVPPGTIVDTITMKMFGNTIVRWGTEEQKRYYIPRIMSGEEVWVQGYSEPSSGSDLGSVSLRAIQEGDEWVLNGQKIWTSRAYEGTGIFVLARTDSTAAKHKGISFLLVPLDQPGVEVRPIRMSSGAMDFCEVFFTDARAPIGNVVGDANGGWTVAMSLLGHERGEEAAINPILFRAELDRLIALARECGKDRDPLVRDRLAWCYTKVETMRFLGYRILTDYVKSGQLGPEASVSKLYWSEYHQVASNLAMAILGAKALVRQGRHPFRYFRTDEPGAPNTTNSWIDVWLLNAKSGTVYAGTSQVQRNIIGETILGLPKEPA